jgi:hypothetical protein
LGDLNDSSSVDISISKLAQVRAACRSQAVFDQSMTRTLWSRLSILLRVSIASALAIKVEKDAIELRNLISSDQISSKRHFNTKIPLKY